MVRARIHDSVSKATSHPNQRKAETPQDRLVLAGGESLDTLDTLAEGEKRVKRRIAHLQDVQLIPAVHGFKTSEIA